MIKIDSHHHLLQEAGYVDNLLREMDRLDIEKSSLIGLGPLFEGLFIKGPLAGPVADNQAVAKVIMKHPDRFFGLGFVRLGKDAPALVDELKDQGFAGLKFTVPIERYSSPGFSPCYDRAQKLGMPCLFHTGIIKLPRPMPEENVSSFNMDCIHLEAVAQKFPDLQIIIAHLGIQSFLTALTLIRMFPNISADLSGTTPGWRANIGMEEWKKYLWFPDAHRKILFGSDVHWNELAAGIELQTSILAAAGIDGDRQADVFCNNAARLYGLRGKSLNFG